VDLNKVYQVYKNFSFTRGNVLCPPDDSNNSRGQSLYQLGKSNRSGIPGLVNKTDIGFSQIKLFQHAKSVLGHISVIEDNIINPVPIYCLSFSSDDRFIITGDNNG
jgi:hypothetical protein